MKQIKFSLADVLTVLAALVFGFICFMGANFYYICNETVWGMSHTAGCISMALVSSLLLFTTAFGAKLLKRAKSNFKTSFILEVLMLTLFGIFAIFFSWKGSPFVHFFTVTEHRTEINSKLQISISQAEKMFSEYESYADSRESQYKSTLKSVVYSKSVDPNTYISYGFNGASGVSDSSQIATKMFTLHADLYPSNYSDRANNNGIKEVALTWLNEAKTITNNWKPIGIVGVVCEIDERSQEWINNLIALSKVREKNEKAIDFEYPISFIDAKSYFTTTGSSNALAFLIAVFIYVLMLLSWFVTKRDSKPYRKVANYEVIL
jgi:hypothetical protein